MKDEELVEVEILGETVRVSKRFAEDFGFHPKQEARRKLNRDILVSVGLISGALITLLLVWLWILSSL